MELSEYTATLKPSTKHRKYEFAKSTFRMHLKPEVLKRGPAIIWYHSIFAKEALTVIFSFYFWKEPYFEMFQLSLKLLSVEKSAIILHFLTNNYRHQRREQGVILGMWLNFIFLTTFSIYLFNSGRNHAFMILLKSKKCAHDIKS